MQIISNCKFPNLSSNRRWQTIPPKFPYFLCVFPFLKKNTLTAFITARRGIAQKCTVTTNNPLAYCYNHFKCLWATLCKMKLEVNSQISKHELKPVLLILLYQFSENSRYYAFVLGFHFFLRHRMRDSALEKQTVTLLFWNYFF